MRRQTLTVLIALAAIPLAMVATSASAEEVNDYDRFELWNDCRPMDLLVEGLDQDSANIGLAVEDIETVVLKRLPAAGLYDAERREHLYVRVAVTRQAFSATMEYRRPVYEPVSDRMGFATTWDTGSIGTHDENANTILIQVWRHRDHFIDEYLRVNADACR